VQQSLTEADEHERVAFYVSFRHSVKHNPTVNYGIWFTDEAHFHLNGDVIKQIISVRGTENPKTVKEMPFPPPKCILMCAVSSSVIDVPIFLDDTVNAERYLELLQDHFTATLQGKIGSSIIDILDHLEWMVLATVLAV
jgi:hypothetical protein